MQVILEMAVFPYYQWANSLIIVRQHDQGASMVYSFFKRLGKMLRYMKLSS